LAKEVTGMISMATKLDDNPDHIRNYRILRKEAELTAYADDIARKYQLTYDNIKGRLGHES
jgi:hypothetical protein